MIYMHVALMVFHVMSLLMSSSLTISLSLTSLTLLSFTISHSLSAMHLKRKIIFYNMIKLNRNVINVESERERRRDFFRYCIFDLFLFLFLTALLLIYRQYFFPLKFIFFFFLFSVAE